MSRISASFSNLLITDNPRQVWKYVNQVKQTEYGLFVTYLTEYVSNWMFIHSDTSGTAALSIDTHTLPSSTFSRCQG